MTVQLSPTAMLWVRTIATTASIVSGVVGLAGIPEDLVTWHVWLTRLQSGVPWWAFLLLSMLLVALTWIPRVRVVAPIPDPALPRVAADAAVQDVSVNGPEPDPQLRAELEQRRAEVDGLRRQVETFTELPNRVIGRLVAGRPLSLRDLQDQLSIPHADRRGIAALEACLGVLGAHHVIERHIGSVESYVLTANWQTHVGAALAVTRPEGVQQR